MRRSLAGYEKINPSNPLKWVVAEEEYPEPTFHSYIGPTFQRSLELRQKLHGLSSGDFRYFLGILEKEPVVTVSVFINNGEVGLYDLAVRRTAPP